MKVALTFLRGLVLLRRFFVRFFSVLFGPAYRVFGKAVRKIVVVVYRGFYGIRRHTKSASSGSRKKLLYLFSNRWVTHVSIILIALVVVVVNLKGSSVRAEGFGEQSLLYGLVSDQLAPSVEEVTAESNIVDREIPDYFGSGLITGTLGTDSHSVEDSYVTTTIGGAIVAPVLVESKPSVAPRADVESYIIVSGDTLGGVAERFGLSLNSLLWANGLSFRSTLKIGQTLAIPPVDGVIHKVRSGDTLSSISRKYGADMENILSFNRLASANDLSIGEQLVIPGGKVSAAVRTTSVAPVKSLFTGTPSTTPARSALPAGSGVWVWPTDLRYITQYYGWRHTGLDVDCNGHLYSTNSNYAAADGVIVYSGWRSGYGYTVDIDHGNGIKTRYAHNAQNYVSSGEVVTAGTPIGLCGNTGRSTGTHLHFEVIVGGRFQNPLEYIR